jgi:hypothetical protein
MRTYLTITFIVFLFLCSNFKELNAAEKPIFSKERGFYKQSFSLTITSRSGKGTIKYTLNGSNPEKSNDAFSSSSPLSIIVDPNSNVGRGLTPAVVVRACLIDANDTSEIETHTYVFPEGIKYQVDVNYALYGNHWPSKRLQPCTSPPNAVNWTVSPNQVYYFGVSPSVLANSQYSSDFRIAMESIPTLSLVSDPENFFDIETGIYNNANWHGIDWEREGSIEIIDVDAKNVSQSNTGIRMRGGFSRIGSVPKHSFRLFFRKEYGTGKLEYPLFKNSDVDKFDKIDIASSQNNSWHNGNSNADFIKDIFARDIQGKMNQPHTRSNYYHLFLNGMYWGLYFTQERPEASYGESYFGGDKEDYDVLKSSGPSADHPPHSLEFTDGNQDLTYELWEIAKQGFSSDANYYQILGKNADGTINPNFKKMVDEENLICFMLINYYANNTDGPALFDGSGRINNFFGIINRENTDGFRFFIHDAEHTFANLNPNILSSGTDVGELFSQFNPLWLHHKLVENLEYRQKFSDIAYHYLNNNGLLTPEKLIALYEKRSNEIQHAIIFESARWGSNIYTKNDSWISAINKIKNNFLTLRTNIFITQLKEKGWLSQLSPATFETNAELVENCYKITSGQSFSMKNPNPSGQIIYTTDGSDPRIPGGGISSVAQHYTGSNIKVNSSMLITARVKNNNDWSPLIQHLFYTESSNENKIVISEIHYHPKSETIVTDTFSKKSLEFIEIKNTSNKAINLTSWKFTNGIAYIFPANTSIAANSLLVLASNSSEFEKFYGFKPLGEYTGNLDNGGEKLLLTNPANDTVFFVHYNKDETWFNETDGMGFSLVYKNYTYDGDRSSSDAWKASSRINGSPGKDDPLYEKPGLVKITEIVANATMPIRNAIELYNPNDAAIDIGNWLLSAEKEGNTQWKIPQGTTIAAKGYKIFYEGHYSGNTLLYAENEFGSSFSLKPEGGNLYLCAALPNSTITGLISFYEYEPTEPNTSFGDYLNTAGETKKVQLASNYLGTANSNAKKSPIIFTTIMYHPWDNTDLFEFIVLKNRTNQPVKLYEEIKGESYKWKVDGIGFIFPEELILPAGDSLYLVEKQISPQLFRELMKINQTKKVYNYNKKLSNSGEAISIQKPVITTDTTNTVYYATVEKVKYNDKKPWPTQADGKGYALSRINHEAFANDPNNWGVAFYVLPVSKPGDNAVVKNNTTKTLDGTMSYDVLSRPLSYDWKLVSKPTGSSASLKNSTTSKPGLTPDKTGNYLVSLQVNNGQEFSSTSFVNIKSIENQQPIAEITATVTTITNWEPVSIMGIKSYDPDYDPITYTWTILDKPEGSTGYLAHDNERITELVADMPGKYKIQLVVSDGETNSKPKTATYTIKADPNNIILAEKQNAKNIVTYPIPTANVLNISFGLQQNDVVKTDVFNLEGKIIYTAVFEKGAGNYIEKIHFNTFAPKNGIYLLRISCSEFSATKRIVYQP